MTETIKEQQSSEDAVETVETAEAAETVSTPKDSYVKLAMRNMVRKGRTSLKHFFLTTFGLIALLIGLAYLTKP